MITFTWRCGMFIGLAVWLSAAHVVAIDASQTGNALPLESLAGDYQAGPTTITVTLLQDRTLTLFLPGQPLYHLVPQGGLRYRIRELAPGYGIDFLRDARGVITGITVHQPPPQQDFSAVRKPGQIVRAAPNPHGAAAPRVPQPVTPSVETRTPGPHPLPQVAPAPQAVPSAPTDSHNSAKPAAQGSDAAPSPATVAPPGAPEGAQAPAASAGVSPLAAGRPSPPTVTSRATAPDTRLPTTSQPATAVSPATTTRTVLVPATIGAVVGLQLRNAMNAALMYSQQKQLLTSEVRRARAAFWNCYPSCTDLARLEQDFAYWLLQKDLYYSWQFKFQNRAGEQMYGAGAGFGRGSTEGWGLIAEKLGGDVDGGLPRECLPLFGGWSFAFDGQGEQSTAVPDLDARLAAAARTAPQRERYQRCRDRHEFYMSSASSPLRSDDPRTLLLGVIGITTPDKGLSLEEMEAQYAMLATAVGAQVVGDITIRIVKAHGRNPYDFGGDVKPKGIPFFEEFKERVSLYDPRAFVMALLHSDAYRDPQPSWAESWKLARQSYDALVAKFGQERVEDVSTRIQKATTWDASIERARVSQPESLGCAYDQPARMCLDQLLQNGVHAVVVPKTAEELAARLPPPLDKQLLDGLAKIKLGRAAVEERPWNGRTIRTNYAGYDLASFYLAKCRDEEQAGAKKEEFRLIPELSNCRILSLVGRFIVDTAGSNSAADAAFVDRDLQRWVLFYMNRQ